MSLAERWWLMVRLCRERELSGVRSKVKVKAWKKRMTGKDPRESIQNNKA